ncbi:portal protein, partial [Proteus mirabilis]
WEVNGEDVYGSSCPGMLALGGTKALQLMQKRKAQMIDKLTNPPLQVPASLKNQRVNTIPGGINYLDEANPTNKIQTIFDVQPVALKALLEDVQDTRQLIDTAYFVDLFRMMQMVNTRSMPIEAVVEMREEKLLQLGPVLQRLDSELLDKLINRTFSILVNKNLLPIAPDEMQGMDLKVEYISVMAQAQKAIGVGSIERFAGFVGNLAKVKPEALDKLNADDAIDNYASAIGVSPTIVATNEQVQAIRQQRQAQQQQMAQMQMAQSAIDGAKTLSDTNLDNDSALSAMAGGGAQ